ncbi:hypothetical protein EYZ01_05305 [Hafnia alvei]|uniref:phage tail terminator-like protein n=1 Tax=Hafnia alvei TaxID=569 RepID=UPI0010345761|nr:phage tail terminator-like protein [Hafnia alvei]TBL40750.1 hypothetical protein EYZ01_05305 [Hafnia alvei]
MTTQRITQLFETKLAVVASALNLKIAMENIVFEPDKNIYLRSHILPASTDVIDLAGTMKVYKGVFQVDIVAPAGTGKTKAGNIADSIIEAFPNNLELSEREFTVWIDGEPNRMRALSDSTRYLIPVSIDYRANTTTE